MEGKNQERTTTEDPADRRSEPRHAFDGLVRVSFERAELAGPGQNVSTRGVLFVADGGIEVLVRIEGREQPITGELIRVQNMGDGKTAVAIRFHDSHPDLVG